MILVNLLAKKQGGFILKTPVNIHYLYGFSTVAAFRSQFGVVLKALWMRVSYPLMLLILFTPPLHAKDVVLQLKWKHQFQFAGFYAALKEGYYEDAGLDVLIRPIDPSTSSVDHVLKGSAQYGVSDASIVLSRLKGADVVIAAPIFQYSPLGLLTLEKSQILSPRVLKDKRIMYQKNVDDAVLAALFMEAGIKEADFEYVEHNFDDAALISDQPVAAMSAYSSDQPFYYKERGIPTKFISPSSYGIDFYGDILFVKESYLESNPDEVAAFREASLRGWEYALRNKEEMVLWILENLDTDKTKAHLMFEAQETERVVLPDVIDLGSYSESRIQRIADIYHRLGLVDGEESLNGIYFEEYSKTDVDFVFLYKVFAIIAVLSFGSVLFISIINKKLTKQIQKKTLEIQAQSDYLKSIKDRLDKAQFITRAGNWEFLVENRELWWSKNLKSIFQLPAKAVPSKELFLELVHPDDRDRVDDAHSAMLINHDPCILNYRLTVLDHEEIHVEETIESSFDDEGNLHSILGVVKDITEYKNESDRLSESEQIYRHMFDNNTAIKLLIDAATGKIVRANDAACEFYGYTHEELTNMSIHEINTLSKKEVKCEMDLALKERRRFYKFRHETADGSIKDVEVHTGPIYIRGEKLLFSIVFDATQRNELKQQLIDNSEQLDRERRRLKASEKDYVTLFNGVSVGIVRQNRKAEITAINKKGCELLEASEDELLFKSSFDPRWKAIDIDGNTLAGTEHPAVKALETGEAQHGCIMGLKFPEKVVWLAVDSEPLLDTGTFRPYAVISSFVDISLRFHYEQELKNSEARLKLAQQVSGLGVWEWNIQSNQVYWSDSMLQLWGINREAFTGDFEIVSEAVHPDDYSAWENDVQLSIIEHRAHDSKFRILRKDTGEERWMYAAGECTYDENGQPLKMTGVCKDITDEYRQDLSLKRAASVFSHAQEGIIITDTEGNIIETNKAFKKITGFEQSEVIGKNPRILKSDRHPPSFYEEMWSQLVDEGRWSGEVWNKAKEGEFFAEKLTISAVTDEHGKTVHYVGVFSDITLQKEREEVLQQEAYRDALTGLPNRSYLDQMIFHSINSRTEHDFSLAFLDLDGFKEINDCLGHDAGDFTLVEVSKRLKGFLRDDDTVVRMGGDEFVIIINGFSNESELEVLAARLLGSVSEVIVFNENDLHVTASLGCVYVKGKGFISGERLIKEADSAMYEAKRSGKNRVVVRPWF